MQKSKCEVLVARVHFLAWECGRVVVANPRLVVSSGYSSSIYVPPHDKTNEMICAPSKDSDQPGGPPSLIGVFAVRMMKGWVLSYP